MNTEYRYFVLDNSLLTVLAFAHIAGLSMALPLGKVIALHYLQGHQAQSYMCMQLLPIMLGGIPYKWNFSLDVPKKVKQSIKVKYLLFYLYLFSPCYSCAGC